ncbi:MAG: hypothetical protein K2R98_18615 [Gemmataceae bacterium]|nr:hypothetical protein [Gemmataceae bacterium]
MSGIVKRLKGTSEKVKRAQILLRADAEGPGWHGVPARAYIKRISFCYTPKHGSWLNVAEIGIWSDKTNAKQRGVDWQFKMGAAANSTG